MASERLSGFLSILEFLPSESFEKIEGFSGVFESLKSYAPPFFFNDSRFEWTKRESGWIPFFVCGNENERKIMWGYLAREIMKEVDGEKRKGLSNAARRKEQSLVRGGMDTRSILNIVCRKWAFLTKVC